MRTRHTLSVVFGSALMLAGTNVFADTVVPAGTNDARQQTYAAQVLSVASGHHRGRNDGEMRLRYPGFEQSTVVHSKDHLVVITMEAVQEQGKAPVQCSCSSYRLRADGPPVLETDLKRLTDYSNGERSEEHTSELQSLV